MARTINRVELLGRVGTEPKLRYTQSGTAVTQLRLGTDRRRASGETDWHGVTCWGKTAEAVNEHVGKGARRYSSPAASPTTRTRAPTVSAASGPRYRQAR